MIMGHPFSKYAKFSGKLTFLTPWYAHVNVHQNSAHLLNEWPPMASVISNKLIKYESQDFLYQPKKTNSFLVKYSHIVVTIIFYLRDVTLNIFKINRFLSKILTGKAKLGLMTSYILFTILLFPEIMIFHFSCWWK